MISLGNAMAEVAEQYEDEPHLQVDSVRVLRKGSLTWTDPVTQKINVCPEPGNASEPSLQTRVKFCSISRPISMSTSREHGHQVQNSGLRGRSSVRETPSSLGAI